MQAVTYKLKFLKAFHITTILTALTSPVFSAHTGDNDGTPPLSPRSTRFQQYDKLFNEFSSAEDDKIKVERALKKFIGTYFPEERPDLQELKSKFSSAWNDFKISADCYDYLVAKLDQLYGPSLMHSYKPREPVRFLKGPPKRGEFLRKAPTPPVAPKNSPNGDVTASKSAPVKVVFIHSIGDKENIPPASESETEAQPYQMPSADSISAYLNERVIGEEMATEALALYVERHYKAIEVNEKLAALGRAEKVRKLNILLAGPTGCGKTACITHLSERVKKPLFIADSSTFTRTGYVGDSVASVIEGLLRAADFNVEEAEKGIVFWDEIDKLAAKEEGAGGRDIAGSDVQAELLKLMEGKEVIVKVGNGPIVQNISVKTHNMLFIGGGAFAGLPADREFYTPNDFVSLGFKPELLGRFGKMVFFEGMTEEKFLKILKSPLASPIQENLLLLEHGYNIKVSFEEDAIKLIAKTANKLGLGVRGLITMVGTSLEPILKRSQELQGTDIKLTRKMIESKLPSEEKRDNKDKFLKILKSPMGESIKANLDILESGYDIKVSFKDDAIELISRKVASAPIPGHSFAMVMETCLHALLRHAEELKGQKINLTAEMVEKYLKEEESATPYFM